MFTILIIDIHCIIRILRGVLFGHDFKCQVSSKSVRQFRRCVARNLLSAMAIGLEQHLRGVSRSQTLVTFKAECMH